MDILGIGPMEILFIVIIALIILGPKEMIKMGKTIGRWLRTIVMSPTWRAVQQTSRDISNLPNKLMREAGVDDLNAQLPDLKQISQDIKLPDISTPLKQASDEITQLASVTTTIPEPKPEDAAPEIHSDEIIPEQTDNEISPQSSDGTRGES
jgi:sec-independent protein translocase protein TatB